MQTEPRKMSEDGAARTVRTRIRRRRRGPAVLALGASLLASALLGMGTRAWSGEELEPAAGDAASMSLDSAGSIHLSSRNLLALDDGFQNKCTPRSVETFPPDLFTLQQKRQGAVSIHIVIAVWLFAALAVVCDDYFVSSLEVICDVLGLKSDVAGATFMAAGSSAPELFTSVIGVFFAESDVGISTIVGSAVFNILFIISMCGIFATQVIYLSWWPIFRDCGYYCISIVALILVIYNGVVDWYESVVFVVLYIIYIVIMYFNENLDKRLSLRYPSLATGGTTAMMRLEEEMDNERVAIVSSTSPNAGAGATTYSQMSMSSGAKNAAKQIGTSEGVAQSNVTTPSESKLQLPQQQPQANRLESKGQLPQLLQQQANRLESKGQLPQKQPPGTRNPKKKKVIKRFHYQ